jgi:hypothetical protein
MSKIYVKDEKGKFHLVEKDDKVETNGSQTRSLSLEVSDARLKKVERVVLDPRK